MYFASVSASGVDHFRFPDLGAEFDAGADDDIDIDVDAHLRLLRMHLTWLRKPW